MISDVHILMIWNFVSCALRASVRVEIEREREKKQSKVKLLAGLKAKLLTKQEFISIAEEGSRSARNGALGVVGP